MKDESNDEEKNENIMRDYEYSMRFE